MTMRNDEKLRKTEISEGNENIETVKEVDERVRLREYEDTFGY